MNGRPDVPVSDQLTDMEMLNQFKKVEKLIEKDKDMLKTLSILLILNVKLKI